MDNKKIGQNILAIMKAKNLTEQDVARRTGFTLNTVKTHTGDNPPTMTLQYMLMYAVVLGCTIDDIMGDADPGIPCSDHRNGNGLAYPLNLAGAVAQMLPDSMNISKDPCEAAYSVYVPIFCERIKELPKEEKRIIGLLYGYKATPEQVGAWLKLSPQKVCETEETALRRLAMHSECWQNDSLYSAAKKRSERDILKEENTELNARYRRVKEMLDADDDERNAFLKECAEMGKLCLENLELSVAAYRAAKMTGIESIEELENNWTIEALKNGKKFRKKTLDEFIAKLHQHGIDLPEK